MLRFLGLVSVFCLFFVACEKKEAKLFAKLDASRTGIDFSNKLTDSPELNILTYLYYYNGAGVAAADFNNDGWTDLFFTANQLADKLYLNDGDFNFREVSNEAELIDDGSWSTGVTYVDINEDGWLDIYVCKVGGHGSLEGRNMLYINQGTGDDGIPVFKESAEEYGLDFSGLSTQASFFDYDLGRRPRYVPYESFRTSQTGPTDEVFNAKKSIRFQATGFLKITAVTLKMSQRKPVYTREKLVTASVSE